MEKIGWLDGWNICISMNAVMNITDGNSYPIGMFLGVVNQIRTFVEKLKLTKVFFILDGPEAGKRRRELYSDYKGKRRITGRESKVQIMEGEDNMIYGVEGAFQNQLIKIYEFLQLLPITVLSVPECEADDMIAYLALKNKDTAENIIISNDRDYLQLIQKNIKVYRWKAKRLYGEKELVDEFKISPKHFIYRKILLGDTSDKIDGIKGIGTKTFDNLSNIFLHEENNFRDVGELVDFFEHLNKDDFKTREKSAIRKIIEGKEKMELLYKLMKLDESCLNIEQQEILRYQIEEQKSKPFARLATKIKMQKTCFNKLYEGFNDDRWLQPFSFLKSGIEIVS